MEERNWKLVKSATVLARRRSNAWFLSYTTLEGRKPSLSEADMSANEPNGKRKFPVEDRRGASRAMV